MKTMKAIVICESLFGNTRAVAEAIVSGLSSVYDASVCASADADLAEIGSCDLIVLGSPTHAHGLPKPETRAAGLKSGVPEAIVRAPGIRELLARLPSGDGKSAAAFDTSLRGPRWLWGAASKQIADSLRTSGYTLVVPPETFLVKGMKTPTMPAAELVRARSWAKSAAEVGARAMFGTHEVGLGAR